MKPDGGIEFMTRSSPGGETMFLGAGSRCVAFVDGLLLTTPSAASVTCYSPFRFRVVIGCHENTKHETSTWIVFRAFVFSRLHSCRKPASGVASARARRPNRRPVGPGGAPPCQRIGNEYPGKCGLQRDRSRCPRNGCTCAALSAPDCQRRSRQTSCRRYRRSA